jgi:hypothetical protein
MKELIKQVLRESREMIIIHDEERDYGKDINSINNIYFQKLESQGLGLWILSRDSKYISKFEKVVNTTELKKYKTNTYRVDAFIITDDKAEKLKKAVDNTNEIIELKYKSIDLMQKYLIASIDKIAKG